MGKLFLSRIPWSYRHRLGRILALQRTIFMATFKPRRLAGSSAGPVDFAESEYFRWIVVALASLPLVATLLVIIRIVGGSGFLSGVGVAPLSNWGSGMSSPSFLWQLGFIWSAGATLAPVAAIAIVLALMLGTAASKYWFRPNSLPIERQNRAMAISGYACAPLAWLFIPAVAAIGFYFRDTQDFGLGVMSAALQRIFFISLPAILLLWWWDTLRMMAGATHCGVGRMVAVGALLPMTWIGCAAIVLGIFPAVVGFLWLVIDSLRS